MDSMQLVIAGAMLAGIGIGFAIAWPLAQYCEWRKSKQAQKIKNEKELYDIDQKIIALVDKRDAIIAKSEQL